MGAGDGHGPNFDLNSRSRFQVFRTRCFPVVLTKTVLLGALALDFSQGWHRNSRRTPPARVTCEGVNVSDHVKHLRGHA